MNRTRRWLLISGVFVAVAAIAIGTAVVLRAVPDHRMTFLVDSSAGGDMNAIRAAVGAVAGNTGDRDSLALRRFGGECGTGDTTRELVGAGAGNKQKISDAMGTVQAAGRPALLDGVLAAIDDFDRRYPFRGRLGNRIIVIAHHGTDACHTDQAAVTARIQDRLRDSGLDLDFRFVGFAVPEAERESFTLLAGAAGAGQPVFPQTSADLEAVLDQLTVPDLPEASEITLPAPPDPTVGWTAFASTDQGYSLRYPPSWVSEECRLDPSFNHWLAERADLIPECVPTDFIYYRVWLRTGEATGPIDTPSAEFYTDIEVSEVTTAGGATGQRSSAVMGPSEFSGAQNEGDRLITYQFDAAGTRYTLTLAIYGDEPSAQLIADFDLMVMNTFRIEG
ncbi:transposase InsO family protein [Catenuloplanes nepalensis]|uniref:Transposase InsO family protein n=1 Tax=Catenuloplanes nepalensis TaxID=587533 RepID=A0ABT9MQZ5_9ACTN|nr:hypothetical protein [Catenuloplanes nepalensis]MDP9793854.1 transposase InsO family protein [Catenuloplanes nepalensis]